MSRHGRPLGPLAAVFKLRARRLLRLLEEQACDEALSRNIAPDCAVAGAWRIVAMVLRRPAFHGVAVLGGLPGEGLRFVLEADGVVGGELGEAAAPVLEVLPQICGVESHGA